MRRQNEESQAREELESGNLDRYNVGQLYFLNSTVIKSAFEQPRKLLESCFDEILSIPNCFNVYIWRLKLLKS